MKKLLTSIFSILLSILLFPISGLAYPASHFKIESLKKINPLEVKRESINEQRIIWDTQCRKQLKIQGGDVKGALRFNLNRCINNKRRQSKLKKRQSKYVSRAKKKQDKRLLQNDKRQRLTNRFIKWNMKKKAKAYRNFSKKLPQTLKAKKRSFLNIRSRKRKIILQKERAIRKKEKGRNSNIRQARESCTNFISFERSKCIREKLKELINN